MKNHHVKMLLIMLLVSVSFIFPITSAQAGNYAMYNYYNSETDKQYSCTWIAWTYAEQVGHPFPNGWGNAGNWVSYARDAGYTVDGNATVHSLACWSAAGAGNSWGHVGYVTEVGDNYIVFHEGGSGWPGNVYGVNDRKIYTWSTYQGKSLWPDQGFIHLTAVTPTPFSATFTPRSQDEYIHDTEAQFGVKCDLNGYLNTNATWFRFQLFDANGNFLAEHGEARYIYTDGYIYHKYRIAADANENNVRYTLSPGTTYKYQYTVWMGDQYAQSDVYTFKTTGTSNVYLDVNGLLDGSNDGNLIGDSNNQPYGTFDIYINGQLAGNDVTDYYNAALLVGTTYDICDIKPTAGKSYDGVTEGNRTGTLNGNTGVRLKFTTIPNSPGVTPTISTFNGHTYYYVSKASTWYAAKYYCEKMGGHLVTITSAAENAFVYQLGGNKSLWIGATDQASEGKFKWVNGETLSYTNWNSGEPNNAVGAHNGSEEYVHLTTDGKWNDSLGSSVYPFVCEFDAAYTISYNANGGTGAPASQTKAYGQDLKLSSTKPTRTGYTFQGWTDGTTAYQPGATYTKNANLTLTAVWQPISYTISYNANGGTGAPASQTKQHGVNLTLSSTKPTREGYTFQHWTDGTNTYQPSATYTKNANLSLTAVWQPITYTIRYDAYGGTGAPANQTKQHGVDVTLSSVVPTMVGHDFKGWATQTMVVSAEYQPGQSVSFNSNTTLYAVWEPQTYTVTFNGNGASVTPVKKWVYYGYVYGTLPTPRKENAIFEGWYLNGTAITETTRVTATQNHTLTAKWKEYTTVTLPAALKKIEEQAFMGSSFYSIIIPNKCTAIGSKAFADCENLLYVCIPRTTLSIAADAFSGSSKVTLRVYEDSNAYYYAVAKNIPYELID